MKQFRFETLILDTIAGGGQALGRLASGQKAFVWGGLPGEKVVIQVTKKKSHFVEGSVTEVITPSPDRIAPTDPASYLSTSPWQIMAFAAEQRHKAALIDQAFQLHHTTLPKPTTVFTDNKQLGYRNKIEFSWWWDTDKNHVDLAFFRRGTHGKIPVEGTSLALPAINRAALAVRNVLRQRAAPAFDLKTVIIRCDQAGNVSLQLYTKTPSFAPFTKSELQLLDTQGFELIYSDPKSPASVITRRLQTVGTPPLTDTILGVPFTYVPEGFFQINLPVYEQALRDMRSWVLTDRPTVDLYSGVGSIGLTIGTNPVTMVESNEAAVREMTRTIHALGRHASATAVLATSENALDYITSNATLIVDPPRAGLHHAVIDQLLAKKPARIIYLSCNPVTQARDIAQLLHQYHISWHQGYNFFPRTPHIEHAIALERRP